MEGTAAPTLDWIDPFCPLLSDRLGVRPVDPPEPSNPAALRTGRALAHFPRGAAAHAAMIDGTPVALDEAVRAAARMISRWRQPLFGGLGTDVSGSRALTRLALRAGAILDHAHGESMTQALRAVQDRGGYTCTLSEIRNRADLIVCIGTSPASLVPDFFERCGIGEAVPDAPSRRDVIFLRPADGGNAAASKDGLATADPVSLGIPAAAGDVHVEALDLPGSDIHVVLAELNAACSGRKVPRAGKDWPALQALAARLQAARYAVLVHALSSHPGGHAALLVETVGRIVNTLNRTTRAAAFALGSADGAATVSQAVTWLTGLPLRTALHARGFEHDPHRFGTRRLLQRGGADGLLWVSSFSPHLLPPVLEEDPVPRVVLGHPAMAAVFRGDAQSHLAGDSIADSIGSDGSTRTPACVFIAVSTPGVNAPGQLFRGDGGIVLALKPFTTTELPAVADIAARLLGLLEKAA